jgi:hypothetical protein
MPYLEVTENFEKTSGKPKGLVKLNQGDIVFAQDYNPQFENTYIHSFILNKKFYVPTAIIKPVILTDKQVTTQRELEAFHQKQEYLKGKSQFTTPVTATADGGDEADAKSGDEADADADAKSGDEAKAYAQYVRRARENVLNWLSTNDQAGGKKKRTKRNKRVKSRRRIKGKSVRRRK